MKRTICRTLCLVLVIASVFSVLCSCSGGNIASYTAAPNNNIISGAAPVRELHSTVRGDLIPVASSGLIQLYFDTRTCSVAVFDGSSARFWTSLPAFAGDSAAMLTAVVISENGRYYLNSQDNSVAFDSYSAEFEENGVKITYNLSDDMNTAQKSADSLSPDELYVSVPVDIRLTDGSMTVTVDTEGIFVSAGYVLESISLMPCFGAVCYTEAAAAAEAPFEPAPVPAEPETVLPEDEAEDELSDDTDGEDDSEPEEAAEIKETAQPENDIYSDFLFVPDGCGAVMYTKLTDTVNERVSFNVYGDEELEDCFAARVPAFGIKKGDSAFVAVIGSGAECAVIKAARASAELDSANKVFAEFRLTDAKTVNNKLYYSDIIRTPVSVCYRFLSGSEANYISMAASCREYLIREGQLSARIESGDDYPVNIAVIGSVDGGYSTAVSGFEETEDMLSVIKAKGINSVNLILQGFFPGGLLQDSSSKAVPMKKTDGSKALEALCGYAAKQKFGVFAGVNILSADSSSNAARTLSGKVLETSVVNPLAPYIGKASYVIKLLAADKIEQNVISLMDSARRLDITGYCINDAAKYAYADRNGDGKSSSAVSELIAGNVSSFASRSSLMLDGCNFNVIKEASYLLNVPFYTQYAENDAYCAVPFIPAILHSTVGYSGRAANTAELPTLELLKCIEYGGIPYFEWVFSMKSHLYYGLNLNDSADFVIRAAKELADLNGARISGHKKLQDGVYMTEFDTGSVIYVNYNNYSVSADMISVSPYDYLRIN